MSYRPRRARPPMWGEDYVPPILYVPALLIVGFLWLIVSAFVPPKWMK
jgi:hypothetical protein